MKMLQEIGEKRASLRERHGVTTEIGNLLYSQNSTGKIGQLLRSLCECNLAKSEQLKGKSMCVLVCGWPRDI